VESTRYTPDGEFCGPHSWSGRGENRKFNGLAGIQTSDGPDSSLVTGLIIESSLQC